MTRDNFFIKDYMKFVQKNFPHSSVINEFNTQQFNEVYYSIQKIIFHCDLCLDIMSDKGDIAFIKEIRNSFFELLYIIPLHDTFLTSSVLRGISESVLRFLVYTSIDNLPYTVVKGFSYSTLKEYFGDETNIKTHSIQKDAQIYFNLFKTESVAIHNPSASISGHSYLDYFIKENSKVYLTQLSKLLKKLWLFHIKDLTSFISLKSYNLSLANKIKVEKKLTNFENSHLS